MKSQDESYARPRIADVKEVMKRIDRDKRATRVSPLLEWWLQQQKEKKVK